MKHNISTLPSYTLSSPNRQQQNLVCPMCFRSSRLLWLHASKVWSSWTASATWKSRWVFLSQGPQSVFKHTCLHKGSKEASFFFGTGIYWQTVWFEKKLLENQIFGPNCIICSRVWTTKVSPKLNCALIASSSANLLITLKTSKQWTGEVTQPSRICP